MAQILAGLGVGISNSMGSIVAHQVIDDEAAAGRRTANPLVMSGVDNPTNL
ncbi:hypothetical protein [Mariniluteicoccus endophyticus]